MGSTANWRIPHQANSADDFRDALGETIRTFPLRRRSWICWGPIILGIVSLSASALALVWFAVQLYTRYYRFGPALAEKEFPFPAILIGAVAVIGILATFRANTIWNRKVTLCEEGLIVSDRRSSSYWLWQEITAFQESVSRVYLVFIFIGARRRYTLHHLDGHQIVLDDSYQDVEQLADKIRHHIFPRLLDRAITDYQAGKQISFGPISLITGGGLRIKKQLYPWSMVQETRTGEGSLLIVLKGGTRSRTISVAGHKILNPDVLLTLLTMDLK